MERYSLNRDSVGNAIFVNPISHSPSMSKGTGNTIVHKLFLFLGKALMLLSLLEIDRYPPPFYDQLSICLCDLWRENNRYRAVWRVDLNGLYQDPRVSIFFLVSSLAPCTGTPASETLLPMERSIFECPILHLAGAFSSWKDDHHHLQIEDIFSAVFFSCSSLSPFFPSLGS